MEDLDLFDPASLNVYIRKYSTKNMLVKAESFHNVSELNSPIKLRHTTSHNSLKAPLMGGTLSRIDKKHLKSGFHTPRIKNTRPLNLSRNATGKLPLLQTSQRSMSEQPFASKGLEQGGKKTGIFNFSQFSQQEIQKNITDRENEARMKAKLKLSRYINSPGDASALVHNRFRRESFIAQKNLS